MRCIFQVQRCIFQLERCIIPIWLPPDISGGRHLENEMYISSGKMYILNGEMYISSTSHQLKYTSFHLTLVLRDPYIYGHDFACSVRGTRINTV